MGTDCLVEKIFHVLVYSITKSASVVYFGATLAFSGVFIL